MDAAVRSFLTYLQVERGASPHTLRNYEGDLRQFLAFLRTAHTGSLPPPTAVDAYAVRSFLAARAGLGDAKSSLGRKLAAIRSLFKYLAREGVVPQSPAAAVVTPKQEHRLPRVLTADDAKRLMANPGSHEPRPLRDQALLEVLYSAGVRVAELVGLNVEDVDLDTGTATALGKGRKERVVLLGTKAVAALRAYLRKEGGEGKTPLFRNARGGGRAARRGEEVVAHECHDPERCPAITPDPHRHSPANQPLH